MEHFCIQNCLRYYRRFYVYHNGLYTGTVYAIDKEGARITAIFHRGFPDDAKLKIEVEC